MEFRIEERAARPVLEVAETVSLMAIPKALQRGFGLISALASAGDIELQGQPYARYLDIDWPKATSRGTLAQLFQLFFGKQAMCAGRFISAQAEGDGQVEARTIPAGRFVVGEHVGPYHKVDQTYKALVQWAGDQELALASASMEVYVSDPGNTPANDLRTEVSVLIVE